MFSLCLIPFAPACGGPAPNDELDIVNSPFKVRADPPGGQFSGPLTVALHTEVPATIYYTTDGRPPTDDGIMYEGPLELSGNVLLTFVAVDEEGIWSRPSVELYERAPLLLPPREAPRMLSLSRPHVYFSARAGDGVLEQKIVATSMGSNHVMVHKAYITAAAGTGSFYEAGIFRLETSVPESTLLAPGEAIELTVSYRPTETLRSAALVFETDDPRVEGGAHAVKLSGRIFNW